MMCWGVQWACGPAPSVHQDVDFFTREAQRVPHPQVQKDFDEVPGDAVGPLRVSLVGLLLRFAGGPSTVRTQLTLAISSLAVHVPAAQWEGGRRAAVVCQPAAERPARGCAALPPGPAQDPARGETLLAGQVIRRAGAGR